MGKLLTYVGENNVLWGTDSIWTGSPQDQIQAWRTFQIAEPLRARHGYPEITPQLRAKVFGLNATKPYKISAEEVKLRTSTIGSGGSGLRVSGRSGPAVPDVRAEDAAGIPELLSWKGGKLGD